jgi:CheY-like chemotaxis protein/nitrogen-specific signal transduction histidine kinase
MALRNEAEELRRRVSELEAALLEAQDQSRRTTALLSERQAAERRKDDFIAMLGHELRNPLAAIQAGLELWASASSERTTWIRQVLTRQTEQLARIVDDLLDLSRINRGKVALRTQTLELSPIVAGALASVNDPLSERGHVLEVCVPDGIRLQADPARLEQILVNLLTNAARYTDEGGHICLRAEQEGDHIRIEVQDNGIGLSPEMLTSVFDMFAQAGDARNEGRGGLGIGLSLIRQLVEMHQGTISAASDGPGQGSTFTVILPVGTVDQEPTAVFDSPRTSRTSIPRRILVIDDNQDLAISLSFLLSESGHTVETAFDGASALDLARVLRPEVTLLDVGLPDMDGYTVADRLRSLAAKFGYRTAIIAVSGFPAERHRNQIKGRGLFDHYLVKPVSMQLLCALIETPVQGQVREGVPPRSGKKESETPAAKSATSGRMLIIDDSKAIADLTQQLLEAEGYETAVAYDGKRGLALASEFKPDVILCDLNLAGDLDGWEIASALRQGQAGPVPVLVALTAWGGDEIRHALKKSAFDFHLSKPLNIRELERLISTSRAQKQTDKLAY